MQFKLLFSFFSTFKRLVLPALLIGVLLVGPLTSYLGGVLMFGLGFTSDAIFVGNGSRLLTDGALAGTQTVFFCLLLLCRPLWCAAVNGIYVAVIQYQWSILSLTPEEVKGIGLRPFVGIVVIETCMAALAGFLTAWLAWQWVRHNAERASPSTVNSPTRTKAPSGFTLVEILVVLATIAVLAALLFPSFTSAREKGRQTTCTSNLHQLGLAVSLYMDDNAGVRPPRFQNFWDSGSIKSQGVLNCSDDPTGNWGGLIYEHTNRSVLHPELPPETVRYSYVDAFGLTDWEWEDLKNTQGGSSGLLICQVHGAYDSNISAGLPDQGKPEVGYYQGLILRLQLDGAVVRRRFVCAPKLMSDGTMLTSYDYWPLYSDAPRLGAKS